MRPVRILIALGAVLAALAPARAQPVVSPAPDSVSVTVYRDPDRGPGDAFNLAWLRGYALITEKRTVTIPAGRATIRFEGVAGGILPESAIVAGLPDGVREKNLDADLLRPWSLYARSLGRPVTIRRKSGAGTVEERAILRSGPEGAAVLQTAEGFIVADCAGGAGQIVYDSVPQDLAVRPTLSVQTDSTAERRVTLTLSYLAWGFDWQANYVATMRPDGRSADLFAWVTLANIDVTGFADAQVMVVAGRLAREDDASDYLSTRRNRGDANELRFQCAVSESSPAPPVLNVSDKVQYRLSPMAGIAAGEEIVVTGSYRARLEELGDLKLYRLPVRTDVAANSQKQVAMIDQKAVQVETIYRARITGDEADRVTMLLRTQNRKDKGLGLPLPAGTLALFMPSGESRELIGEASIGDKAVNEEVEFEFGEATQVVAEVKEVEWDGDWEEQELTVTNASPWPIRFEADFQLDDDVRRASASARLGRKNGRDLWSVEIPANGTAKLRYRLVDVD